MLCVALLSFSLFNFVGDPINNMVGEETSTEERAELRETLGLNDPIHIQFGRFVANAIQFNFGKSYQLRRPVSELIAERMPATLELVITSSILALGFGVFLGVYTGINRTGVLSNFILFVSLAGVIAHIRDRHPANLYLCSNFGHSAVLWTWRGCADRFLEYRPSDRIRAEGTDPPSLTLSLFQMTYIIRLVRAEIVEILQTDYIKFARARGISNHSVYFGHALRNSLIPVVTIAGDQYWYARCFFDHHRDCFPMARNGLFIHSGGQICRYPDYVGLSGLHRAGVRCYQFHRRHSVFPDRSASAN